MQKTNFKTRLLALLTAVFMVVVSMPFAAFAAATDAGTGTGTGADKIHVTFTNWEGAGIEYVATEVAENSVTEEDGVVKAIAYDVDGNSAYKFPKALATEDKVVKGWKIAGTETAFNATDFNYVSLAKIADNGYVNVEADIEDKQPETKNVTFCFQLETSKGNFTDKNIAGLTSTNVPYIVGGEDTVVNVPDVKANEGYTFKGWTDDNGDFIMTGATYDMFGKDFSAYENGQTIWMTAVFEKVEQPVDNKELNVVFYNGNGEKVSEQTLKVATDTAKVPAATDIKYDESKYVFDGKWAIKASNVAATDIVTAFDYNTLIDLATKNATGGYRVKLYPVLTERKADDKPTKEPVAKVKTNVSKIYVSWYDGEGTDGIYKRGYVFRDEKDGVTTTVAPATDINAKPYNYTWNVDELVKNVNDVVTFDELLKHCGSVGYDLVKDENNNMVEDNQTVVAYVQFVKTEIPAEVNIKNVHFIVDNKNGESWANTKDEKVYNDEKIFDRTYTVRSDVTEKVTAPAAAVKEGKDFLYWECTQGSTPNTKKYRLNAGAEFNFDTLTQLGLPASESGDFNFVAVFKDKASSSSSSSSSSSNKTTAASSKAAEQKVVKAAAAPANTTKVLPKTGASNVAPLLGGSLAVVALLMGYGVYSLVLRKKD